MKPLNLSGYKNVVELAGQRFFPLDKKLGLLSGSATPQVQEALTRLGSRMTYAEAQEELRLMWGVTFSKASVCNTTMRHGRALIEAEEERTKKIEEQAEKPTAMPKQVVVSTDGAMVQLTTGEWREVKLAAFGEFEGKITPTSGEVKAKTDTVSYFARLETAEQFTQSALLEWHYRGGENAEQVVAVNDGAVWIQSFIDHHCPDAIRVIDFAHAQEYVAAAGKAAFGEDKSRFGPWFKQMSELLGTQPPTETINRLRLLQRQQTNEAVIEEIDRSICYLRKRSEMIDYPRFRRMQIPIGSGMSESGHKVVMQRRMKQAGMRWAEKNVNPMLTLRTGLCNGRWQETWSMIRVHQAATNKVQEKQPPEPLSATIDSTPVTTKDCDRLAAIVKKSKSRSPWSNHNDIFYKRSRSVHRN